MTHASDKANEAWIESCSGCPLVIGLILTALVRHVDIMTLMRAHGHWHGRPSSAQARGAVVLLYGSTVCSIVKVTVCSKVRSESLIHFVISSQYFGPLGRACNSTRKNTRTTKRGTRNFTEKIDLF